MREERKTFQHIIGIMEVWTDLMAERPVRKASTQEGAPSVEELLDRLSLAAKDLTEVSRRILNEGRLDQMLLDTREEPPVAKPLGGSMVHVITHSMHHRAQALYLIEQLGLTHRPEGDALGWEHQAFGW